MDTDLRPIAEKRYHRIIVNVTDDEIADNMLGSAMYTMLRPVQSGCRLTTNSARVPSKNDHHNPDERTNQIMFFDCVGRTETDPLVRYELGSMFDLLMIDRRNCCLVNFKPLRNRPTNFFNNVLVPEVEKRLIMLQGTMTLRSIKLEYYDVQKYDVVNMCNITKATQTKRKNNELIFQNTRELLRWTQRTYPKLWGHGSEHDFFDLEFVFVEAPCELDRSGTNVTVKLSLLQFYLNKMDGDMRVGLRNFLENVSHSDFRMKHSILTDYLREYFFNEEDSWQIWMLFDVPSVNYGSSLANDMLTLASAAFVGVHDKNMLVNNSAPELLLTPAYRKKTITRQTAGQYFTTSPSTSGSTPLNTKAKSTSILANAKLGNYSLSFWFCRIDESYINVITSLERYYDRKYELKVKKMCGDLKRMTRNIDDTTKMNQVTLDDTDIESDESLQAYFKQYKEALSAFRVLIQKVERTKYAEQLRVFVEAKNNEIAKQTRQMKVRLLELCQARISNTIRDEVKTLNTEKELSNDMNKTVKST